MSRAINALPIPLLKIKNIIFTVSPVRHWSDGVVENTRSKAILHLFVKELQESFDHVYYFHSYELMLDELRDYRFYKQDMLHPSNEAIASFGMRLRILISLKKHCKL